MKKLVLFVSVLALGLTSCSKDDDGGSSASLEGKWEYSKDGMSVNGNEALLDYDHSENCPKDYMQITATTVVDHYFYNDGTPECDEEIDSSTYTRDGNTLSVTVDGTTYTGEILQLDGSTLKIATEEEEVQGQNVRYITVYTRR